MANVPEIAIYYRNAEKGKMTLQIILVTKCH